MAKKYLFVVVSKNTDFSIKEIDFKTSTINTDIVVEVKQISNNTCSLGKIYNSFLDNRSSYECIVFMHADVKLNIEKLIEHIESVKSKYAIIGLCGCDKISLKQMPLNWYTGSNPFPMNRWGCVTHGELGNQTSFFSADKIELDHEVACIDGLCIIFTKQALDSSIKFDEQFDFSHYDTDISLQCILNEHLKLGVIVRKDLQHYSVGKSILTPEFLIAEQKFRKKWNIQN